MKTPKEKPDVITDYQQADKGMARIATLVANVSTANSRTEVLAKWEMLKSKIQMFIDYIDEVAMAMEGGQDDTDGNTNVHGCGHVSDGNVPKVRTIERAN